MSINIKEYIKIKNILFKQDTLEHTLLSLKSNRFLIFTGPHGSGKTQLALFIAQWYEQGQNKKRYIFIPAPSFVNPNPSLLSFGRHLAQYCQQTEVMDLMVTAQKDPENPYFIIVDHLADLKQCQFLYPFLVSAETGEPLSLYKEDEKRGIAIQRTTVPSNVYFLGTVHKFSELKAWKSTFIQRASVIFLKDPLNIIDAIQRQENKPFLSEERLQKVASLDKALTNVSLKDMEAALGQSKIDKEGYVVVQRLKYQLQDVKDILNKSEITLSYRTISQILRYVYWALENDGMPEYWTNFYSVLDEQFMQKIVPLVEGVDVTTYLYKLLRFMCYSSQGNGSYVSRVLTGHQPLPLEYDLAQLKYPRFEKWLVDRIGPGF